MVLVDISKGQSVMIKDISSLAHIIKRRLLDLGISDGVKVCLKNHMPFGGPYMIEYKGQNIGIRKSEAALIKVELL